MIYNVFNSFCKAGIVRMESVEIMLPCGREHDFDAFAPSNFAHVWYFFPLVVFMFFGGCLSARTRLSLEPVGQLFVDVRLSWGSPWAFFRFNAISFVPPGSRADLLVSFGGGIGPKWSQNRFQIPTIWNPFC